MPRLSTVFWDIGGVILTNGWDIDSRQAAANRFQLNWQSFEKLHDALFPDFEKGQLTLGEYLDGTVFREPRLFSREEFTSFMFAQSKEYTEARAILTSMSRAGQYFIGAINNEPLELNEYRIHKFNLQCEFMVFFSSCYVQARKPGEEIFRVALQVTQKLPEECLFIDDREENLVSPRRMNMDTIHYQNAIKLRAELNGHGIRLDG